MTLNELLKWPKVLGQYHNITDLWWDLQKYLKMLPLTTLVVHKFKLWVKNMSKNLTIESAYLLVILTFHESMTEIGNLL